MVALSPHVPPPRKCSLFGDPWVFRMQAGAHRLYQGPLVSPRVVLGEGPAQPGLSGWVGGSGSAVKCLLLIGGLVAMVTD